VHKVLIAAGADLTIKNEEGTTARELAVAQAAKLVKTGSENSWNNWTAGEKAAADECLRCWPEATLQVKFN